MYCGYGENFFVQRAYMQKYSGVKGQQIGSALPNG